MGITLLKIPLLIGMYYLSSNDLFLSDLLYSAISGKSTISPPEPSSAQEFLDFNSWMDPRLKSIPRMEQYQSKKQTGGLLLQLLPLNLFLSPTCCSVCYVRHGLGTDVKIATDKQTLGFWDS